VSGLFCAKHPKGEFLAKESRHLFLAPDDVPRLVGVIDLSGSMPVRAVAGERGQYHPITAGPTRRPWSVEQLVDHYRELGLRRIYVADLEGLVARNPDWETLARVAEAGASFQEILVDFGWRGDEASAERRQAARLAATFSSIRWIAASESADDSVAVRRLAELVGPDRVLAGFDYCQGCWRSGGVDEAGWIHAAGRSEVSGGIVLDVAAVGTASGPVTTAICRRISDALPSLRLFSGGGIRSRRDVRAFVEAGCEGCLVATALLPGAVREVDADRGQVTTVRRIVRNG